MPIFLAEMAVSKKLSIPEQYSYDASGSISLLNLLCQRDHEIEI